MNNLTRIAVIGDFNEKQPSHQATVDALDHVAEILPFETGSQWFPTAPFEVADGLTVLEVFDGIWGAPGVPESSPGFINAIQVARENAIPYLGT